MVRYMCKFFCIVLSVYLSKQLHQCTIFFLASWAIQLYHWQSKFWCTSDPWTSLNRPTLFSLQHFFSMFSSIPRTSWTGQTYSPTIFLYRIQSGFCVFFWVVLLVSFSATTPMNHLLFHTFSKSILSLVITISMHV